MQIFNAKTSEADISAVTRIAFAQALARQSGAVQDAANDNAAKRGGIRLELLADLDPNPRKDWLIYSFLADAAFSVVYGEPSAGKSVLAADIALHVAAGIPFFGAPVRQSAVVYFAGERKSLMARRFRGLALCRDVPIETPIYLASGDLDIRADASADAFIDAIDKTQDDGGRGAGLVILDTMSRALMGGDENSSVDVGNAMRNIERIRERCDAHILALHHVGTSTDSKTRMRGSSLILGAVDASFLVTGGNGGLVVKAMKDNDPGPVPFALRAGITGFVTGKDEEGNDVSIPHLSEPAGNMVGRPLVSLSKKLTKVGTAALDALTKAIAESGELPPADASDCPTDRPSVSSDAWRAAFFAEAEKENPQPTPAASRMRFARASTELAAAGRVRSNGSRYWIVE